MNGRELETGLDRIWAATKTLRERPAGFKDSEWTFLYRRV